MFDSVLDTTLFNDIHIKDESYVISKFSLRCVPKNYILFYQGDPGNEMYLIKSGVLKIFKQDEEKEIILGHQFAGETIGELEVIHHNNKRLASVATLEPSFLWMIRKPDLEELILLYPQLLRKFFYVVSERLNQADRKIEYLAFLDARVRVANLLLDLYSNFGKRVETGHFINWKFTQQHLANMLGIGRESAARALLDYQQEGLISLQNRMITIHDLEVLRQRAGQQHETIESRKWHSQHKYDTTI